MRSCGVRVSLVVLAACLIAAALPAPSFAGGPYQYHSITPCRLADTRNATGPSGGPILVDQGIRSFPVQGLCGVPVGAKAATVNVTAVGPTGAGFLTLYPSGITRPVVSNINFSAGEPALGNGAIVPLADQGTYPQDLTVFSRVVGPGSVHMVLDITGYFE
jgi:hypothetical protein